MLDGVQVSGYATALGTLAGIYLTLRASHRHTEPPEVRAVKRALWASARREGKAARDLDRARVALVLEQREKLRLRELLADSAIPPGHPRVPTDTIPAQPAATLPATHPASPSAPASNPGGVILGP